MAIKTPITVAYGDGIGPEIMTATLRILEAAQANIDIDVIDIGKKAYLDGFTSGIPDSAWASIFRTRVLLKAPITTPQGGGYKSLNVTLRKTLSLFANVRPCTAYYPYVPTKFPNMNLVIVRENEEDLYAGIEHRQTEDVYQCLKLITRHGCERIIRYAFEYAKKFNRKKVTCFSKDNIMKMTDGIFHKVFNEIAAEFKDIANEHMIVDIGTALLASKPEHFDVIVTSNLYGDIISDVAAQIAGSVGLAGSANIGTHAAMFEAIHGSAPDIAGKNIANPSGLLNAAVQMLIHIDQPDTASLIENAWLCTLEDGIHTGDIYSAERSQEKVTTDKFADAIIARLGKKPANLATVDYPADAHTKLSCVGEQTKPVANKQLVGVDIFIDNADNLPPEKLANQLTALKSPLQLVVITSRGLKVWPNMTVQDPCIQHTCCRFQSATAVSDLTPITYDDILALLEAIHALQLDIIKTENLYTFDGELGFTLAQGQ